MAGGALTKFFPESLFFGIFKSHHLSSRQYFLSAVHTHTSEVAVGYLHKLQKAYSH